MFSRTGSEQELKQPLRTWIKRDKDQDESGTATSCRYSALHDIEELRRHFHVGSAQTFSLGSFLDFTLARFSSHSMAASQSVLWVPTPPSDLYLLEVMAQC